MVLPTAKKQNDHPTISQLYQHFESPTCTSRDIFKNTLEQLSSKSFEIGMALCRIRDKGILDLENFSLILEHPLPFEISSALIQLHDSNLLNPENKEALERHTCPAGIALVLRLLRSVKLLTSENRTAIQKKADPYLVASVLFKLYYADLLTQKNFDHVLSHPNLSTVITLLHEFDRHNILAQIKFEELTFGQKKNSSRFGINESKETMTLYKNKKNSNFHYVNVNFFPLYKALQDKDSHINTAEFNREIFKN